MRKYKDLLLFILTTLVWSVFVSMLKFFLRSYLKDINISLEEIMWYIALWCMFSYLVWGSLTYFFRKKHITIFALLVSIVSLICWYFLWYYPFRVFVVLMSIIWFVYGLWLIVKSIILSMEMQNSQFSETSLNGAINITILWWTILGSYLWFSTYARFWEQGMWFMCILLLLWILSSLFFSYDKQFPTTHIWWSLRIAIPSILAVIKKYFWLLVPIGVLRAISAAVGQKMLELGIDVFNKVPKSSITIILISMIWAIGGHVLSAFFKKHKRYLSMAFVVILWLCTFYFPYILNKYDYYITLTLSSFFMWVFFGIAVNLLEWRFFYHIWEDQKKEYWSAAYGISTNIVIFFIMLVSDILTTYVGMIIPFVFFWTTLLFMPLFIRKFK